MPKSRVRRKQTFTPPPTKTSPTAGVSARWVAPTMVALFLVGLTWTVVYYLTSGAWPIEALGWWNLVVGFGFIFAGLMVATRWK